MDGMKLLLTCVLCCGYAITPAPATPAAPIAGPSSIDRWQTFITDAARQFGIPDSWIRGVMRAESGGRTILNGKPITSVKGAMGLMQIMPGTYRGLRAQYGLGSDAYDPRDNIFAGAAYLRQMYERYGYPSLFAAYNAGPKRLDDFLLHRQSLPRATLNYVGGIVPGAEIALSHGSGALQISSSENTVLAVSNNVTARPNALFFMQNAGQSASNLPAEGPPAPSHTVESNAGFSSASSAALFVPLSGGNR